MNDKTENTRRLAKNTLLLYGRSLFNLFVALYSSRLVLQALGVVDYGINNVVGGFVSMFWLVTGSLSGAISRFLTYELGRGDQRQLDKVFSISLNILLVSALIALILAETFGVWYVRNRLNIPDDRDAAALVVFHFSILTVITGFILVPYNASIIAHEKMGFYAYVGIGETLIKLVIAIFLVYGKYTVDRLILYSLLWTLATLAMQGAAMLYCRKHFTECRFRMIFEKKTFLDLFSYAGWSFIGSISSTFSGQGVSIILNRMFGPVINAARGLTGTVANTIAIFVNNFSMALKPQVTKAYATGELDYMKFLVFRGSKFSFFIMFFFVLPISLETAYVLDLWLVEYPDHTISFIRLSMLTNTCNLMYLYFTMAQQATGDIKRYQLVISIFSFIIFPLSYVFLKLGTPPEIVYVIGFVISLCITAWTLITVKKSLGFRISEAFRQVYFKLFLVVLTATPVPLILHLLLPYGLVRFLIVGTACVLCTCMSVFWLGCNVGEREYILNSASNYLKRFRK